MWGAVAMLAIERLVLRNPNDRVVAPPRRARSRGTRGELGICRGRVWDRRGRPLLLRLERDVLSRRSWRLRLPAVLIRACVVRRTRGPQKCARERLQFVRASRVLRLLPRQRSRWRRGDSLLRCLLISSRSSMSTSTRNRRPVNLRRPNERIGQKRTGGRSLGPRGGPRCGLRADRPRVWDDPAHFAEWDRRGAVSGCWDGRGIGAAGAVGVSLRVVSRKWALGPQRRAPAASCVR